MGKSTQGAPKKVAKPSSPHRPYLPERFEIPERASSLAPKQIQLEIQLLKRSQTDLKRKASQLSASSKASNPTEFLDNRLEQVKNHDQQFLLLFRGIKESFEKGEIEQPRFKKLAEHCWSKRAKLANEELFISRERAQIFEELLEFKPDQADEPDLEAAYVALFTNIFQGQQPSAGWESRNRHEHQTWKDGLREHYNLYDPENEESVWCPILKQYLARDSTKVAHIVPHSLGYTNAGYMFGEPENGAGLLWSMKNGIVMSSNLERAFGHGDFILAPISTEPGRPSRWKVVLMNEDLRELTPLPHIKWSALDGVELDFKNSNRPGGRFLYYHFVSTVLRFVRYEKPGWAEKRLTPPTGKIWATPGAYLRKSMVRVLAKFIGDFEDYELFSDGTFEGSDNKKPEEEDLIAKAILVLREKPNMLEQEADDDVES